MTAPRLQLAIRKGLDLPLGGRPGQQIEASSPVRSVALLGDDYPGLRVSPAVSEGDRVEVGQVLFHDRARPGVRFTSPGAGIVRAIHRGARRSLRSIVVDLDGDACVPFEAFDRRELSRLRADVVRELLLRSGLWTSLRQRPFGGVPAADAHPHALFVTATDTNPLAPAPAVIVADDPAAFADGLTLLERLVDAPIFLCTAPGADVPPGDPSRTTVVEVCGPHPAGLVGTHIHRLFPASLSRTVWHVGYQDVIAIGRLATTGRLAVERIVSVAGPTVRRPRLVRTRLGASIDDLLRGEQTDEPARVVSGSVLAGRTASGPLAFLGRYHNQVSAVPDSPPATGSRTPMRAWSRHRRLWPSLRRASFTTAVHGLAGPMIPLDSFERVLPFDILPTPFFRALLVGDWEMAQALGCLELEEEDLALCSFVCPARIDYGALVRAALNQIETHR